MERRRQPGILRSCQFHMLSALNEKLKNAQDLSITQAASLCAAFLEEDLTDAAIAETLVLLSEKGETADEICGFSQALLHRAAPVPFASGTVDVCGTGGSDLERFNVSTAAAFVLACTGLKIAKHGNRGSKRPNGSFDLLEALEVPFELDGDQVTHCLEQTGIGFLFARRFHPTMRKVVEARRLANRRTIFNLAAPRPRASAPRAGLWSADRCQCRHIGHRAGRRC